MDDDRVLYVYRCGECGHAGQIRLPVDGHNGVFQECKACGAKVALEWGGGVTVEVGRPPHLVSLARTWREKHGYVGRGGVVIVFNGIADGWVYKLRNAHHQRPGCVAVDEEGKMWTSIGGTEQGGALMWLPNDEIAE